MHVRIPLTRNNLLLSSPLLSLSFSSPFPSCFFQSPAASNPMPAAFAGMCVHVLLEFIARGFALRSSIRPYSCRESRARRRKTFRDFSQSRCGNVRKFQETPRASIFDNEKSRSRARAYTESTPTRTRNFIHERWASLRHLYTHIRLYKRFISLI